MRIACLVAAAALLHANAACATSFTIIHQFTGSLGGNDGDDPEQAPVVTSTGVLFGATAGGGQYNEGTIYSFVPPATAGGSWTGGVVYSFGGINAGGQVPRGQLLLAPDGSLYGVTEIGGANGQGSVFHLTQSGGGWTETTLFDFDASTPGGWAPQAGLIMDKTGALYGTASSGGTGNAGVVFKLTPSAPRWAETVLHTFISGGADGTSPSYGVLVMDKTGHLYGTTAGGGVNLAGTAYRLAPPSGGGAPWKETILHSFGAAGDGETLEGGLILAGGKLYGTTDGTDSAGGQGIVFSLSPPAAGQTNWTETILYDFAPGGPFGSYPRAGVVRDAAGNLLCLTNSGGANALGTVFRLKNSSGVYTPDDVYDFTAAANKVFGTLSAGKAGKFYGVTYNSTSGYGALFQVKP